MKKISHIIERWNVRDYEGILTTQLPLFDIIAPEGQSFCDIMLDFVQECPQELKEQYPVSMLRFAYMLYIAERRKQADDLMLSIRAGIESASREDERRTLLGEWMFVKSLFQYPDIYEMLSFMKQADELVEGCVSVISANDPFLVSLTNPVAVFHTSAGQVDAQGEAFSQFVSLYERLTNGGGCGATELYNASLCYYRGDFKQSQLLCYKATYLAESTGQVSLQMGAASFLGKIAIHKMDMNAFSDAVELLHHAASFSTEYNDMIGQLIAIERNELFLEVPITDHVPDWVKKSRPEFSQGITNSFVKFMRLRYFFFTEKYEQSIGLGEAMLRQSNNYSVLLQALIGMFVGFSYFQHGDQKYGINMFKEYFPLLFKDRLYLVFAYFYEAMDGMLDDYLKKEFPDDVESIFTVMEDIRQGRMHFMQTYMKNGNDLSEKELEVARLAAEGLQNKEISSRLGISTNTVRAHLRKIFEKLEISRRGEISERLNAI